MKTCEGYEKLDTEKSADPVDAAKPKRKSKVAKAVRKAGKAIMGDIVESMRMYREKYPTAPSLYPVTTICV